MMMLEIPYPWVRGVVIAVLTRAALLLQTQIQEHSGS